MLSNNKNLKIGAMLSYFTIIFNVVLGIVYTPWMIDQLGKSDYGIYNLVISIIAIFAMDFGLGQAVSKFLSKYKSLGQEDKIKSFLGAVYTLYMIIAAIIFVALLVMFFLLENIYIKLNSSEIDRLKVCFIITGLFSVFSFPFQPLNGILIAEQKFAVAKVLDLASKILTVGMIIIMLIAKKGLYGLVLVNAGVGFFIILIKFLYIRIGLKVKPKFGKIEGKLIKQIFAFSIFVTIMTISDHLTRGLMPSILGITSGSTEIAVYSVANTIIGYVFMLSLALDGLFLPKVTQYVVDENYEALNKLALKVGRLQMLICGCVITVFIGCGQEFIRVWVGSDFKMAYYGIVAICIPLLFTLTQTLGSTIMIANDNVKHIAKWYLTNLIIVIPLAVGLSLIWGTLGVCIAIAVGNFIVKVVVFTVLFQTKAKLNMKKMYLNIQGKALLPILLVLAICYVVQRYMPVDSIILCLIKCAVIGGVYVVGVGLMFYHKQVATTVKKIVNRIKK